MKFFRSRNPRSEDVEDDILLSQRDKQTEDGRIWQNISPPPKKKSIRSIKIHIKLSTIFRKGGKRVVPTSCNHAYPEDSDDEQART